MQINVSTLSALFKGYRTLFLDAYQAGKPMWDRYSMKTGSASAEEIYHWLGSFPGMEEFKGDPKIDNLTASRYTIPNKEWNKIIGIKRAEIERDAYGIYNPIFQTLGVVAKQHPDELTANLLLNGFVTQDYTGKNFFDVNKTQDPGGPTKLSNKGTGGLGPNNYAAALAAIKSVRGSTNRPMNLGQKLLLVVPPQLEQTGKQILEADFIMQTAANTGTIAAAAAVTNVNKGTAELVVLPYLSAQPTYWFILEVGFPIRPLILQVEKEVELTSLINPDSEHVFLEKEFLYQGYGRYNAGYGLPQLAWGSTGADVAA